jgi:hypothetical protein
MLNDGMPPHDRPLKNKRRRMRGNPGESAMSEVIYLEASRFSRRRRAEPALKVETSGRRVYVREAHSGIWLVHDERDSKGGCFRGRQAAFDYVERQFGARAELVVQPLFSTAAKRSISHFRQSASVAQRAIAAP